MLHWRTYQNIIIRRIQSSKESRYAHVLSHRKCSLHFAEVSYHEWTLENLKKIVVSFGILWKGRATVGNHKVKNGPRHLLRKIKVTDRDFQTMDECLGDLVRQGGCASSRAEESWFFPQRSSCEQHTDKRLQQ